MQESSGTFVEASRGAGAPGAAGPLRGKVRERGLAALKQVLIGAGVSLAAALGLSMLVVLPSPAIGQTKEIARGKYLVGVTGCNDCHTPGYFFGKPDMTRFLSGSEV